MCRQTRHNKSNPIPHQPHQHPTSSTSFPAINSTPANSTPRHHRSLPKLLCGRQLPDATTSIATRPRPRRQHNHHRINNGRGKTLTYPRLQSSRVHLALRRSNSPRHGCSTARNRFLHPQV
ncbi:uncharacterized protein M6B38_138755 [Iris pallida]|uniref:Uncharacterized protein n=1 Tax=Iris pallida TaxID=29817 RepID=A0AAX6FEU1_IRIPA|nr:uncharacterized protein M6B38_138755 [Iris pallida]